MAESNRVEVQLFEQAETSQHKSSRRFAILLVSCRTAKWTDLTRKKIQLLTKETWQQVKARFRDVALEVPVILPTREPMNLDLYYPNSAYFVKGEGLMRKPV